MRKVWHREFDGWWYVTLRLEGKRRQIKLVQAPPNRQGRDLAEEKLLEELSTRKQDQGPVAPGWLTVEHVLKGFLKHSEQEHEPATYEWYKGFFDTFLPKFGKLRVSQLKKHHVMQWVKSRGFSPTSQNRGIGAIKRAFQWAVEEEHIPRSPIAHIRKPRGTVRDRILTIEERKIIFDATPDQEFKFYLTALSLTGCRPGEVTRVRKEEVDLERGIWILKKHKTSKKTGKPRLIFLCPEVLELTKRMIEACPDDGPIFRNTRGEPWTRNAVRLRFTAMRKKHPELKGVSAYTFRSAFATDALEAGVPDATVATLLGHSNTNTLHRFYARLSHKVAHLQDAGKKAIGGGEPQPGSDRGSA